MRKLGRSVNEALTIAEEIGYPVALKVQASEISYSSDVGGVALDITDAESLRGDWQTMMDDVGRRAPGVELDGILIEKMGKHGLKLLIGAKHDALWGPTILIGVGGIWVKACGEIRTLAPQLELAEIEQEFRKLKATKLFDGFPRQSSGRSACGSASRCADQPINRRSSCSGGLPACLRLRCCSHRNTPDTVYFNCHPLAAAA